MLILIALAFLCPLLSSHIAPCRLRLDQILHGIALAFVSVEAALTLLAMLTFWRAHRF